MSKKSIFAAIAAAVFVAVLIVVALSSSKDAPLAGRQQAGIEAPASAPQPPAAQSGAAATPAGTDAVKSEAGAEAPALAKKDLVAVTSVSIADRDVLIRNKPIVVSFSAPMVPKSALENPVAEDDLPFILEPPVSGQGRWLTEDSFAFVASSAGFAAGKEYSLRFKDDLKALDGKPVRYFFSFKTEATQLSSLDTGFVVKETQELPVHLRFSPAVSPEAVREHVSFTDAEGGEKLDYEISTDVDDTANSYTLRVKLNKERSRIALSIRTDREGDKAPLGFSREYKSSFELKGAKASIKTGKDEPSSISMYWVDDWDRDGEISVRYRLRPGLASHEQKEFIKVTPDLPFTLSQSNDALYFKKGVEPGMTLTVKLLPGLVDSSGRTLKEERSHTVTVRDLRTAVEFTDKGQFLTPVYGNRIGLTMTNADQINVQIYRQYENNLSLMALDPEYFVKNLMRDVYFKSIRIKDVKKNESARRALDMEELTQGKKGVYRVNLSAYKQEVDSDGDSYMSYESSSERLVVISDIGATARVFPSGITVFASSISTAEPLVDALVKVYSRSNQLIAVGSTGPNGVYINQRAEPWDDQLQPNVITVQAGEGEDVDMTFLPLDYTTRANQSDNGVRAYLDKGYEAFLYTPRGVFRPGEKVDIKAFVRNKDQLPPSPFPVLFKITNPRGTEMARGSVTLSAEGGADFAFSLPGSAPTGDYSATLEIPGQPSSLGFCYFSVEDFVPPRLEVSLAPQAKTLQGEGNLALNLSGQYLFGAPGSGLNYELGYKASLKGFSPNGYEGYYFGDGEKPFSAETNLRYLTGSLDEAGLQEADFSAPDGWDSSSLLHVLLILSVQEDGGRWVSKTEAIDYFPKPYLLGIKTEGAGLSPGNPANFSVAAVTPSGELADSGKLSVEISRIQSNWHTVYRDGRYVYNWEERLIAYEALNVDSENGKASFSFTPAQSGRYLIRVATDDGAIVATRRVGIWGSGGEEAEEGTGRMDLVELSFDKKEYKVGDTAKLSVKAPYAGTLFLGIERGSQITTRVQRLEQPAVTLDIPVIKEMNPNATITAWVMRPLREEDKEWYAHRAHGHISLPLAKEPHELKVSAQAPARATPSKPLSIPFTVTDHQGIPVEGEFSVALIDEGILSLTMFKTPDPVKYFMAQRYMVGSSYDAYDALLRPEAKATELLTAGGGGMADYQGSLSTEQIFLTGYVPTVRTDANGQGEAVFDIPEYSGKGRLMIVGASKDRFASADTQIRFARDIVMETSAPRAVAPGDSFSLSLKLFTLASEEGDKPEGTASIRISAEGPVTLSGETEKSFSLLPLEGQNAVNHSLEVQAKAGQSSGIVRYTVLIDVPGREDLAFSKTFETVVRPPYPRTAFAMTKMLRAGEEESLVIPGEWLPGSGKLSFSIDRSPVMAILPALQFLSEYPYGCLEQTVSRAWPWLTMSEIQKALYPTADGKSMENNVNAILAETVGRVSSMMTPQGGFGLWPGYTTPDPWKSVNAAFFLNEAKAKVAVPPSVFSSVMGYLRFCLAAPIEHYYNERYGYSTKAYAAFVLTRAGEAPLGWLQSLSEHEDKMYPSGRIFLAGAKALKAGNPNALMALDAQKLEIKGRIAYNESLESNLRNQSLLLYCWSLVAPGDSRAADLSADVAERLDKLRWYNPQDSGMAALALGTYLEKTGTGSTKGYTANISLDGKEIAKVEKGERLLLGNDKLPMEGSSAPKLKIALGEEGNAYCTYSLRGVPMRAPEASSSDMVVQRIWKDADGNVLDLSSGTVRVKKGDRITVELTVKPAYEISDVVLSDLTPGGVEVENPRLSTTAASATGEGSATCGMYVDQREDRLLVFFDRLYDEVEYSYTMRAVTKGTFVLPPLAADGMYAPEVNAITQSGTLIVE